MSPARKQVNISIQKLATGFNLNQRVLFVGVDAVWDYKSLFNCSYDTLDIKSSTSPDILGDIQNCGEIVDNSYDAVIMTGVWEYLQDHHKAMDEIYRILKKGGKLLLCAPGFSYYGFGKPHMELISMHDWFDKFKLSEIKIIYYKNNMPNYFYIQAIK